VSNELTTFNFEITSLQQAMEYAKMIADSDLAPKDYKGKPGNVLITIQYGTEIGLKPLQSIQNLAIINGRPSIWGDAMIALVQNHPLCEYIREEFKNDIAYCTVKRRGEDEYTYEFSKQDAQKAGLLTKPGPWSQYPNRMLQMRARGFALRDKFSDVLKGIAMREEVEDYEIIEARVERNNAAKQNITKLIENKQKTAVINDSLTNDAIKSPELNFLEEVIKNAKTIEDLSKAIDTAKELQNASERNEARRLYKIKLEELKKAILEDTENTDKIVYHNLEKDDFQLEYEKVKHQLLNAKSQETLHLAADLIRSCDEKYHSELIEIYNERKIQC
jgi:hypothetical protein